MSHITQAQQGLEAAKARKWDEALEKLSAALKVSPNPAWLIARSKALISLGRFQESLDDANLAFHTAYDRNKRDLLSDAQYRRAVAYFRLKQYANADACCVYAMRLIKGKPAIEKQDPAKANTNEEGFYTVTLEDAKKEAATDSINTQRPNMAGMTGATKDVPHATEWRTASTLRTQILFAMEKLPSDDPGRKLTTSAKPAKKAVADLQNPKPVEEQPKPTAPKVQAGPLRLQDFQTNTTMSVSIFSKGVNKEKLVVHYLPSAVLLDPIIHPDGSEGPYRLNLWGEVDAEGSKYTVTPNKVELSLKKKTPGKWAQLKSEAKEDTDVDAKEQAELDLLKESRKKAMEAADEPKPANDDKAKENVAPSQPAEPAKPKAPSYPTSSKHGAKDWDAIAKDEEDVPEEGSDVNEFFKKLYKDANPDQQRAMMKSFLESNGTTLSTDWNDVKDRVVETNPPAGVEAKPYSQ